MTASPSRRWFQLSLRSLFGLTLLVATFFAGYVLRAKQDEETLRIEREARQAAEQSAQAAELDALTRWSLNTGDSGTSRW